MGTWTLERLVGSFSDFDTTELYGTNFRARFWMRYKPATLEKYVETPLLDWHELILMREHHKNQWWDFETNMYEHNPLSNTLKIWPGRYIYAYNSVHGIGEFNLKGSVQLTDKDGLAVPPEKLGTANNDAAKADRVRSYLKDKGGVLVIEVHDIPSINMPKHGEHKERLLKFNVGVVGQSLRMEAEQYLDVDAAKQKQAWTRRFQLGWKTGWIPGACPKVAAPTSVSMTRQPVFADGEYW
ncbi:MAG: hypothetical protein IT435_12920 [Phycisphaerales bacterium]|nr:hypothetical protein [Phycisphaerales bacterium]